MGMIDEEKVKGVGIEVIHLCADRNLNDMEMLVMFDALEDTVKRGIVLKAVLGDNFDEIIEAMMKVDAEKAIKEAEEALKEGE